MKKIISFDLTKEDIRLLIGSTKYSLNECKEKMKKYPRPNDVETDSHTFEAFHELRRTTQNYLQLLNELQEL